MKTNAVQRQSAFTLIEIMIVVAIIGLLSGIAIPNFVKSRITAQRNACVSNLRVIDNAKDEWAVASKKPEGARAKKSEVNLYLKGLATPKCPTRGTYHYRPVGSIPRCSIDGHALSTILDMGGAEDED